MQLDSDLPVDPLGQLLEWVLKQGQLDLGKPQSVLRLRNGTLLFDPAFPLFPSRGDSLSIRCPLYTRTSVNLEQHRYEWFRTRFHIPPTPEKES